MANRIVVTRFTDNGDYAAVTPANTFFAALEEMDPDYELISCTPTETVWADQGYGGTTYALTIVTRHHKLSRAEVYELQTKCALYPSGDTADISEPDDPPTYYDNMARTDEPPMWYEGDEITNLPF
jgi:hypothetical protein